MEKKGLKSGKRRDVIKTIGAAGATGVLGLSLIHI